MCFPLLTNAEKDALLTSTQGGKDFMSGSRRALIPSRIVLRGSLLPAAIVLLAFLVRLLALWQYGLHLNLHSDDEGYTRSAIRLLELGRLTYHTANEHTVHMMPGISLLLAAVFAVFGWHTVGLYAAKLVMIGFGCLAVYAVYKIGETLCKPWVGVIAALIAALYPPEVLMDNLLLTEPPFTAVFLWMLYFTIRLWQTQRWSYFFLTVATYLLALLFRPTVGLYPVVIAVYLWARRYPRRLLLKQALLGALIVSAALLPWWVRNYHYYHTFIPLTGGTGDPLLLGTYQGTGYPPQPTYLQVVHHIAATHPNLSAYDMMQYEEAAAKERMRQWWDTNPGSMLLSYLLLKPVEFWADTFYWIPIFHVSTTLAQWMKTALVLLGFAGFAVTLTVDRDRRLEVLWLLATLGYYTALYSYYFAFGRYSEPLMPIVFTGIGAGLYTIRTIALGRHRTTGSSHEFTVKPV
jgi:4-amino-4-deoxy-L-arabinose transferase-like glycosyltransferase